MHTPTNGLVVLDDGAVGLDVLSASLASQILCAGERCLGSTVKLQKESRLPWVKE